MTAKEDQLKAQLAEANKRIRQLQDQLNTPAARSRVTWHTISSRITIALDNLMRDLPTIAESKHLAEVEWMSLDGLRERLQRLDARLALLAQQRKNTIEEPTE